MRANQRSEPTVAGRENALQIARRREGNSENSLVRKRPGKQHYGDGFARQLFGRIVPTMWKTILTQNGPFASR